MLPREIIATITDRIEDLDFGYESDNTAQDTQEAALDIALALGNITAAQRQRIESEDRNQRTFEYWAVRLRNKRRWDAMAPEQRELELSVRDGLAAQSRTLEAMYWSVLDIGFKWSGE